MKCEGSPCWGAFFVLDADFYDFVFKCLKELRAVVFIPQLWFASFGDI